MRRKLQVFVSSTYDDLKAERQSAVEAILKAGHIPAGMELFTAGSESQLNVIRRWIEESDVYVLILGGRYGSIETSSGCSYTEVEFDFARSIDKPFFSIVISDAGLEEKVRTMGTAALEKLNEQKYRDFRTKVTSQLCAFFATPQEVRLAVFETLPQIDGAINKGGWVAAADVTPSENVARELTALLEENRSLRSQVEKLKAELARTGSSTPSFDDLFRAMAAERIAVPANVTGKATPVEMTLVDLALYFADDLARGVSNRIGASADEAFLFYDVASRLASYGLAEHTRVPVSAAWQRLKLSKDGVRFLTQSRVRAQGNAQLGAADLEVADRTSGTTGGGESPQAPARAHKRYRRRSKGEPDISTQSG